MEPTPTYQELIRELKLEIKYRTEILKLYPYMGRTAKIRLKKLSRINSEESEKAIRYTKSIIGGTT